MRKLLVLLLALVLLCACAPVAPSEPSDTEQTPGTTQQTNTDENGKIVFSVDEVKKLSEFSDGRENYSRYYDEFVGEFIPSEDYGEIVPFIGGFVSDEYGHYREARIGFCTLDGKIVCDPVYSGVVCSNSENYIFYVVRIPEIEDTAEDKYLSTSSTKGLITRNDGKVAVEIDSANYDGIYIGENSINVYSREIDGYLFYNEDLEQIPDSLNPPRESSEEEPYRCPGCKRKVTDVEYCYNSFRSEGRYKTAYMHKGCGVSTAEGEFLFELPYYERSYLNGADNDYIWGHYMDSAEYDPTANVTFIFDRKTETLHTVDGYGSWRRLNKTKFCLTKIDPESGMQHTFVYDISDNSISSCDGALFMVNVMCYVENGVSKVVDENYNEIISLSINAD